MRLYLVRHAVTAETGKVLSGRLPDIPLSPEGVAMAEALASRVGDLRPSTLVTSPVQRCRETARILGGAWQLRPRVNRAFDEADFGDWSGRTLKSLYRLKAWGRLMTSASRFRFPNGETLEEVQCRAVAGAEALAASHRKERVVLVSHSDVIRSLLAHYLGMPLDLIHRIDVRPASVSLIHLPPESPPHVPFFNDVAPRSWP